MVPFRLFPCQVSHLLSSRATILNGTVPSASLALPSPSLQKQHLHYIRNMSGKISHILYKKDGDWKDGVPITYPDGLDPTLVEKFYPLITWIDALKDSLSLQTTNPMHHFHQDPYTLRSVNIKSHVIFQGNNPRIGFLKVVAEVKNTAGDWLPATVFLRGPSVAMLFILTPDDDQSASNRHVVLTIQPRVAAGSLGFMELPAGMVDNKGNFAPTAAKEIQEELGITVKPRDLVCLSDLAAAPLSGASPPGQDGKAGGQEEEDKGELLPEAVFPSPGACDEYIKIFLYEEKVSREKLHELAGKKTGLRKEGENITVAVVKMDSMWRTCRRDAKALSALALYNGLKREGKI